MNTADILDRSLPSLSEGESSKIASIDFEEDVKQNLGRVNGNIYQRVPGVESVHDGQIIIRLLKMRFIVLDYSIVPNAADLAFARNNPHVMIPSGAGVKKCASPNCSKIGVPVCVFDSDPGEHLCHYLKCGLCFNCQKKSNHKRRAQKKRKPDEADVEVPRKRIPSKSTLRFHGEVIDLSHDAIIIDGPPVEGTRCRGPGYEYPQIIDDVENASKDLFRQTVDLSRMVSKYSLQGGVSAHFGAIDHLFQSAFASASKSMFLLHQWKLSLDESISSSIQTAVTDSSIAEAVASAAAFAAAQSSSLPSLPNDTEDHQTAHINEVGV